MYVYCNKLTTHWEDPQSLSYHKLWLSKDGILFVTLNSRLALIVMIVMILMILMILIILIISITLIILFILIIMNIWKTYWQLEIKRI